jgi:hypothetical protein
MHDAGYPVLDRRGGPNRVQGLRGARDVQSGNDPGSRAQWGIRRGACACLTSIPTRFGLRLIEELQPIIATQHIIGPLYLTKFATANGQQAWDITDEAPSV